MASKNSHEDSDSDQRRSVVTEEDGISHETINIRRVCNMEEDLVGNVSKFSAYPPGFQGAVQPGLLMFHACYQSGNLGRVDCISPFEYDLFVRPDTCNPRYRMWFNFTVQNIVCGQKVIFNIVNFSKTKSLYREGMSPLVKSTSRPKWQRVPSKNVFYYKSPEHHKNYVMSFAFAFDLERDVYQFCYCFPYTYNKLQSYLSELECLNLEYFKREQLCLTVQQRNVDLLTITSPRNFSRDKKRHVVFFTARVHPGESPSSYVCQGVIDFLISDHPYAQVLRDHVVFMIVPMLNPDGVVLGNYRCSLMGFDLNRYWQDPSPWAHPSIVATKQLLMQLDSDPLVTLDFYIDLHAHSTSMNSFMYGNIYEEDGRFEQHTIFPKLLCTNAEDFSFSSTLFNKDVIKAGTGRRTLGTCLSDQSNCYTLEVSFYSYIVNGTTVVPYTEEGYMKLGRNVARTFLDYYKLNSKVSQKVRKSLVEYETMKKRKSFQERKSKDTTDGKLNSMSVRRNSYCVPRKTSCEQESHFRSNSYVPLRLKHRSSK